MPGIRDTTKRQTACISLGVYILTYYAENGKVECTQDRAFLWFREPQRGPPGGIEIGMGAGSGVLWGEQWSARVLQVTEEILTFTLGKMEIHCGDWEGEEIGCDLHFKRTGYRGRVRLLQAVNGHGWALFPLYT